MQKVSSYLGYTGRDANVVVTATRDPKAENRCVANILSGHWGFADAICSLRAFQPLRLKADIGFADDDIAFRNKLIAGASFWHASQDTGTMKVQQRLNVGNPRYVPRAQDSYNPT